MEIWDYKNITSNGRHWNARKRNDLRSFQGRTGFICTYSRHLNPSRHTEFLLHSEQFTHLFIKWFIFFKPTNRKLAVSCVNTPNGNHPKIQDPLIHKTHDDKSPIFFTLLIPIFQTVLQNLISNNERGKNQSDYDSKRQCSGKKPQSCVILKMARKKLFANNAKNRKPFGDHLEKGRRTRKRHLTIHSFHELHAKKN